MTNNIQTVIREGNKLYKCSECGETSKRRYNAIADGVFYKFCINVEYFSPFKILSGIYTKWTSPRIEPEFFAR